MIDSEDQLIEYYFQRRLGGMTIEEVRKSLLDNKLGEEATGFIVRQVERKEIFYNKYQYKRKLGLYLLIFGFTLLLLGVGYLVYHFFFSSVSQAFMLLYGLTLGGMLVTTSGYILRQRKF
jgi:hypothetical protein